MVRRFTDIIAAHVTSESIIVSFVSYIDHAKEVTVVKSAIESAHADTVTRLQKEVRQLQKLNQDLQQKYQQKHLECKEKVVLCHLLLYVEA